VPLSGAGANEAWEDAELHAAMRAYWSAYADAPQWAIWVLFAGVGRSSTLMGTMFDDSDRNQRQGVAIFNKGFEDEKNIPASYPQRPEHMRRERFFGLVHETGHCFNLHHAWWRYNSQLTWPFFETAEGSATFMNYPNKVAGFYSQFRYEFHGSDIKFMRHAPPDFVEMGNERFWPGEDELGREVDFAGAWELSVELPRSRGVFEFPRAGHARGHVAQHQPSSTGRRRAHARGCGASHSPHRLRVRRSPTGPPRAAVRAVLLLADATRPGATRVAADDVLRQRRPGWLVPVRAGRLHAAGGAGDR
jgi:hypothetical protein